MEVNSLTCMPRLPPWKKKEAPDVVRPLADFHPTVWGEFFIRSMPPADQKDRAWMQQRVEKLKEDVRRMFVKNARNCERLEEEMDLVDVLQRLGLAYHFKTEISEALVRIHDSPEVDGEDLLVVSLRFRLLRQEGYNISSDGFNQFRDVDGHFRRNLGSNVKALLSLYEAAHLATGADVVLEEAITFCTAQLEPMLDHLQPSLAAEVARALETPLIRRINRAETRQFISFYEASEGRDDLILELAKLDFNLVQSFHQEEIRCLTGWWEELGLLKKLTFARDRLVECYYWAIGVMHEPQFACARTRLTKVIALISVLDDIYDAYGTLEELHLLTDVIQRWGIDAVEELPEYVKIYFIALSKTLKEFGDELKEESYRARHLKNEFKVLAKAYLKEAEWSNKGHVPTLNDHLQVSLITSCASIIPCASFHSMGDIATEEVFNWLTSNPKIVEASAIIVRLTADIMAYKFEQKRQHVASTVECYMKEYDVSEDMACQKLRKMVDVAWKVINEEWIQHSTKIPLQLLTVHFNNARVAEIFYKHDDGYTHSIGATKDVINLLLVKCISI